MRRLARARLFCAVLLLPFAVPLGCAEHPASESATDVEILWDVWGVPHVFARSEEALFRGFGWAQMHGHGELILRLFGAARGRAAEYWGPEHLDSDRWVWTVGIPERAQAWYAAQTPDFRRKLDAFAAGVNVYARAHPREFGPDVRAVLPIDGVDLLAHQQRVTHFSFVASEGAVARAGSALLRGGSNGWVVGPARSESGNALLMANPHLPWSERCLFFEAHLVCSGAPAQGAAYSAYGATLVGFPTLAIAFNERLGWTHTVNTHDGADLYELTLDGDNYRWDGALAPLEVETRTLRVARAGGGFDEVALPVRRSVHGPLIRAQGSRAIALRVVGLDRPHALRQWWEMGRARDLELFENALRMLQVPTFTVLYADRDGNILHLFGGLTPVRAQADRDWSAVVPGDVSSTLWTDVHPYEELPRVVNPPSGWLQNANDPPWTCTLPAELEPARFPPYMAPRFMHFRAQRSARVLMEDEHISLDELVSDKQSTRMEVADRLLDDLLPVARAAESELVRQAADVLERWDRCADAGSRGALLFVSMLKQLEGGKSIFAVPWDPARPTETPDGIADPARVVLALESAARGLLQSPGALDAAWGDSFRLRKGGLDLPCSGGMESLGVLRVVEFAPDPDGKRRGVAGDSFVAAVEFSDPVRARVLTLYGNASQGETPPAGEQLELAARKELRPAWLARAEIEAHLAEREWVPRE